MSVVYVCVCVCVCVSVYVCGAQLDKYLIRLTFHRLTVRHAPDSLSHFLDSQLDMHQIRSHISQTNS